MNIGKLWFAVLLGAVPATASAQPLATADVAVTVGDNYNTSAPGVPVESVDVFYDQLAPYGVWVDDPTIGHVFIPAQDGYVPYTSGHWQYTDVGFVWIPNDSWAIQTSHYGRWAYSQPFARWVWLPDTTWGPAWVEWRQSGDDFGWAPLAPEVVVNAGYTPPIEAWHYCGASHVLDANVSRYYEPRARVEEIHRVAQPMQHYATVGNARVVVGPPAATLRQYKITAKPVKVSAKVTGRVASASEAHAQVARAQARKPQLEAQNKTRIQANTKISAVVAKHPAAGRMEATAKKPEPTRTHAPATTRTEAATPRTEATTKKAEPTRTPAATPRAEETKKPEPTRTPTPTPRTEATTKKAEPTRTPAPTPRAEETKKAEPTRTPAATPRTETAKKPEPAATPRAETAKKPEPTHTTETKERDKRDH